MDNDELVEVMHELEEDAAEWRTDVDDVETTVSSGVSGGFSGGAMHVGTRSRQSSTEHDTNDRGASAILREAGLFGIKVHSTRDVGNVGNGSSRHLDCVVDVPAAPSSSDPSSKVDDEASPSSPSPRASNRAALTEFYQRRDASKIGNIEKLLTVPVATLRASIMTHYNECPPLLDEAPVGEGEAKGSGGSGESYIDPNVFDEAAAKGKHERFRDLDRDAAAKASRSHAFVKIKVPEGARGGQRMSVALKGGKTLKVTIPPGAKPGQLMRVKVREGDTVYILQVFGVLVQ